MQGLPQARPSLVKLLKGFHSPPAACRLVEWRDRYRNFDPHNQPINFSSLRAACQRAGSEMQGLLGTQRPSRSC
jgi:hypothetical protein